MQTLIKNVALFDGETLLSGADHAILVENDLIKEVGDNSLTAAEDAHIYDGQGLLLCPGFVATHEHLMWSMQGPLTALDEYHWGYLGALGAVMAKRWLEWGFTTIRSAGGPDQGIQRAIDEGIIPGPRIFPSGAPLSATGGHGDWRHYNNLHPNLGGTRSPHELFGHTVVADGVHEMMTASREQFSHGATQLKLMGSGGVASIFDPIDMHGFTEEEIKASVSIAENYGSYCMAHTYNSETTQRLLRCGVKSIEHGMLCDDETFRMMSDMGAYLSTQAFAALIILAEENIPEFFTPDQKSKGRAVREGFKTMAELADKHKVKVTWSTDLVLGEALVSQAPQEWAVRSQIWSSLDILRQATSRAAELVQLCGNRNPYGRMGVIGAGALADIVLVNPKVGSDASLLAKPEENIALVMKGGEVFLNRLNHSNFA